MKTTPVSAHTRVFAILGDPIAHSRSPIIHNAAMQAAGLDAVYVALRCDAKDLRSVLRGVARAGGGGNITLPHKGSAAEAVDRPSARVRATRACNTYWHRGNHIYGDNTDVIGFSAARREVLQDLHGARALILGAGGGARAVLHALLEDGCAGVTVLGRTRKRSAEVMHVAGRRARRVAYVTHERLLRAEGFDLVINATPLGLHTRDPFPLQLSKLAGVTAVLDIVYRPGGTPWINYARSLGIPAADGAEMLIQQAAAAFELWFEQPAPIAAMRSAFAS